MRGKEEINLEEALAADLKGQPTLSIEEFMEKYENKLEKAYSAETNEAMLNNNLDDVRTFETYVEIMYVTYLEDYISDFYEEKFEDDIEDDGNEEDDLDDVAHEPEPYSGFDAVE